MVLCLSQDGACTDSFENFRENSLKGDLSNDITLNRPLFSLVNTFNLTDSFPFFSGLLFSCYIKLSAESTLKYPIQYGITSFIINVIDPTRRRARRGKDRDEEMGDGGCEKKRLFIVKVLYKKNVGSPFHSATSSCSIELYKLWYTFAVFFAILGYFAGFPLVTFNWF